MHSACQSRQRIAGCAKLFDSRCLNASRCCAAEWKRRGTVVDLTCRESKTRQCADAQSQEKRAAGPQDLPPQFLSDLFCPRPLSPRASNVVDAELVGMAGPPGCRLEPDSRTCSVTRIGARELMIDRHHGGLTDAPTQTGLHVGYRRNDQSGGGPPGGVVVLAVPGCGPSEPLAPTIGRGTAAASVGISRSEDQRGGCQNQAQEQFLHCLDSLVKTKARSASEQSGGWRSNRSAVVETTKRVSASGLVRRHSSGSRCGGAGTAIRGASAADR